MLSLPKDASTTTIEGKPNFIATWPADTRVISESGPVRQQRYRMDAELGS